MKRFLYFILLTFICVACTTETIVELSPGNQSVAIPQQLYVTFEESDTRTQLNSDRETIWTADDAVAVFYYSNGRSKYTFQGETGDRSGELSCSLEVEGRDAIDKIVAIYPYSEDYSMDVVNECVSIELPSTQNYLYGSYGVGNNTMTYVGTSKNLKFKNLCGYLIINLKGSDVISSITLKGNNGEKIAGGAKYYYNEQRLDMSTYVDAITLDCGGGVQLSEITPTEFFFVLPPQIFSKGVTVEIADKSGATMTKSTSNKIVIGRNTIQPMAAFDVVLTKNDVPADNEIWYTTSDGKSLSLRQNIFDATIKVHELVDDHYVITFDKPVTTIKVNGSIGAFDSISTLTSISLPNSIVEIQDYAFYDCVNLKTIRMSEGVQSVGKMVFYNCVALEEVTLPASIKSLSHGVFFDCKNLTKITIFATTPPQLGENAIPKSATIYVLDSAYVAYKEDFVWRNYNIETISGEESEDADLYAPNDDNYRSSDYSANDQYVLLQGATKGNGINIFLMGDAYSDRQIASGRYEKDMRKAMEILFSEEPYTTFRDHFNVYMIKCVSKCEGYGGYKKWGDTAFNCTVKSNGISIDGDTGNAKAYAESIVGEETADESVMIVIMNSNVYAGVCYISTPYFNQGNYGNGPSIAFFPLCGNDEVFAQLLLHEACGHGFAKLADEYYYSGNGRITLGDYYMAMDLEQFGWYKNIDYIRFDWQTHEPIYDYINESTVKWRHFLSDPRYANEGLGIYEGAFTYYKGAYRPTENSIMHHKTGGFNAPSREAIYIRIHKLAYGDDWEYDYEEFVKYDAKNRK